MKLRFQPDSKGLPYLYAKVENKTVGVLFKGGPPAYRSYRIMSIGDTNLNEKKFHSLSFCKKAIAKELRI